VAGIRPTSVTTAVIFDGGVRSYNGLIAAKFLRAGISVPDVDKTDWGAIKKAMVYMIKLLIFMVLDLPNSFFIKLSSKIPSENL